MIGESWRIKAAIEGFSAQIGLPVQQASDGSYNFTLSRSGSLSFSPSESGERLLVSLSWKETGPEADVHWLRLRTAGFDSHMNRFLHCAVSEEGDLIYVFEFDETELDEATIRAAVQRMVELRAA